MHLCGILNAVYHLEIAHTFREMVDAQKWSGSEGIDLKIIDLYISGS
jgi:hypothetical protein